MKRTFSGKNKSRYFSFKTSHGRQFKKGLYVGGGLGLDVFRSNTKGFDGHYTKELWLPVFAEVRETFLKKRVSPFISEQFGYTFAFSIPANSLFQNFGGVMSEAKIGLRVFMTQKVALNISAGYRLQHMIRTVKETSIYFPSQFGNDPSQLQQTTSTNGTLHIQSFAHFAVLQLGFTF